MVARKAGDGFAPDEHVAGGVPAKRLLTLAAAVLLGAALMAVFASIDARPAEARGHKKCSLSPRCAAVGWFYGEWTGTLERINVSDNRTDGYGAVLHYEYYSPSGARGDRGQIFDTKNNGHGTPRILRIPEGWTASFNVCLSKNFNYVPGTCSRSPVFRV